MNLTNVKCRFLIGISPSRIRLPSQNIIIGIAVGMFLVGMVFGYVAFTGSTHSGNMMIGNQQTMIQDPQFSQQMMDSITQDPETMRIWMEDTQHAEEMGMMMRENHDFSMQMISTMIEDPSIRLQMLGHMTENPETIQQMKNMMGSDMMINNMTGGMMDSGMQGMMNKEMMTEIMQNPEAKEKNDESNVKAHRRNAKFTFFRID